MIHISNGQFFIFEFKYPPRNFYQILFIFYLEFWEILDNRQNENDFIELIFYF